LIYGNRIAPDAGRQVAHCATAVRTRCE